MRLDIAAFRKNRGFTLIELMIVVAIVGILAVLAVIGVRKYLASAKTAEARNSLGQIGKDAATQFEGEGMKGDVLTPGSSAAISRQLCQSASKTVPADKSKIKGQKYQAAQSEWNTDIATAHKGFSCLKFQIDQPQYYMYNYTSDETGDGKGTKFDATAEGDLNGDDKTSKFTLSGKIAADNGNLLQVSPNITEENPEE